MERVGEVNQYVCDDCGHTITTIVRYDGTTPAFLFRFCKSPDGCKGDMSSAWYRVAPGLTPEWEWYKPDAEELAKLDAGSQDHVEQGGLLLRRIEVSDEIEPEQLAMLQELREGPVVVEIGEARLSAHRRCRLALADTGRDTVEQFEAAGCTWHDEIVYRQPRGTAHLRVRCWRVNRRALRNHEYVLVFLKGDLEDFRPSDDGEEAQTNGGSGARG